MKILLLDIETAPNIVHVWGLWNQNVAINQIIRRGYTICWAAKWYGDRKIMFSSRYEDTPPKMIKKVWALIDEADVVVHYNGTKFDMPTLNTEFLVLGLPPPSTYQNVDLYRVCKQMFRVASYKLDYIVQMLEIGKKVPHKGHQLWIDCMNGIESAWRTMKRYNKGDITILESLYRKLIGWIHNHPNQNVYNDNGERVCVNCGSKRVKGKGWAYTPMNKYQRFICKDCGKNMRGRRTVLSDETRATMVASAR